MYKLISALLFLCQLGMGLTFLPTVVLAMSEAESQQAEPEKGPHNGRMLRDGAFAIELAIFETGVPPEFRVWITDGGKPVDPQTVELNIKLTRLGGVVDDIRFKPEGDYLRGDTVIYEPHSFVVTIEAIYQGKSHHWQYDNFEGRTRIEDKIAQAMGIQTERAGPATLHETIKVYGKLVLPADAKRQIQARFEGEIQKVHVRLGDSVQAGQVLLTIESNESLRSYPVRAPIAGVISRQYANSGEQSAGRTLLEISSLATLQAELAVYPLDLTKVKHNAPVTLNINGFQQPYSAQIEGAYPSLRDDQARLYWALIDNADGHLTADLFVTAQIEVGTQDVPLAVKRSGLQSFRDFTVVYAKVGDEYEVRMLELGRQAGDWVEVLGGLEPGTEYVTENSYLIKADIEKSGASHDH